jgi:peptide/nickel transport system permease protein
VLTGNAPAIVVLDRPAAEPRGRARLRAATTFARKQPVGAISFVVLLLLVLVALAAPALAPFNPDQQFPGRRYARPLTDFVLGGDQFGRDLLSRIIYGARISLLVGFASTIIGGVIGAALGVASGYLGGKIDLVVQRLIDTLQAFPGLILAMALVIAFRPSTLSVIVAIAVPTIPLGTRVIRSVTLQVKQLDYVTGAQAVGASGFRIMSQHILPQVIAPLIVICSVRVGQAIVTEATLGFIGLGIPPPTATWGQMLSQATKAFFLAPWISIFPGLALSITVFSLNLLGDALRDALDPKLRGR